ncbi:hypothetical protein [Halobellus marinus]|uniref:hypothetical protein n=1 Tax=Halobellus TaxID=1073986 RepID=UPI0028ADD13A|nr:hypothetical protein [Halobellus sp. DFY28]
MRRTHTTRRAKRLAVVLALIVALGGVAGVVGAGSVAAAGAAAEGATDTQALSDTNIRAQTSAGSTSVRLTPTTATIAAGESQEYDIVVSDVDGGVGAVTATISVDDTDVVSIGDVDLNGDPGVETVDVESDGSEVFVRAALMDTDDSGSVTIGTVSVEGVDQGSTDLSLDVESLGNEEGEPYDVGATPGSSLSVEGSADATPLAISADESTVEPGDQVDFEVRRGDSDALVSATVHVGGEAYETGLDGVATVRITEEMGSDAETITAVASKEATDEESFRNDSVTLDLGGEDAGTATATPPDTETPEPGDGPRVTLRPASASVGVGEETEWRLVAAGVDGGVGAVEAQIRLESTETARITDVELEGDAGVEQTEIQGDGAGAVIRGALMDTNDTGVAHIATLTVEGVESGTTQAAVSVDSLGDEDGNSYEVGSTPSATLSVGSADDGGSEGGTSTVVLSVSEMSNGFERASVTVRTAVDASVTDTQAEMVSGSQLRVVSDGPRATTVQAVDLAGDVDAFEEPRTIARLTYDKRLSADDVEIEVENLQNDDGDSVSGDRISVEVQAGGLFEESLPGADTGAAPTDPDGDGRYEDVDGDGEVTFDDAVALSFVDTTELSSEQVAALDFDEDGDLDMDDAVALAFE